MRSRKRGEIYDLSYSGGADWKLEEAVQLREQGAACGILCVKERHQLSSRSIPGEVT